MTAQPDPHGRAALGDEPIGDVHEERVGGRLALHGDLRLVRQEHERADHLAVEPHLVAPAGRSRATS